MGGRFHAELLPVPAPLSMPGTPTPNAALNGRKYVAAVGRGTGTGLPVYL
jgi:hypothetical protein